MGPGSRTKSSKPWPAGPLLWLPCRLTISRRHSAAFDSAIFIPPTLGFGAAATQWSTDSLDRSKVDLLQPLNGFLPTMVPQHKAIARRGHSFPRFRMLHEEQDILCELLRIAGHEKL